MRCKLIRLFVLTGFMVSSAYGLTFQTVGPTNYGDDALSATVNPYPAIAVSTIASPPGQCSWINTGLNNFIAANPTNGSGPTGQSWSYNWAGVAAEAKVEAGINILDYYPYVGTDPNITTANGTNYPSDGSTGEFGGCVFNISYTPNATNGAPVIPGLRWIQALTGTRRGVGLPPVLDTPFNGGGAPFTAQSNLTPFYDPLGAAGTYGGNTNGYFMDAPSINEAEYDTNNLVASVQFQVVLATDAQSVIGGVTNNALTLYGGDWWGFTFSAVDVPEPSAGLLVMLGGSGLLFFRRRVQRKRAV